MQRWNGWGEDYIVLDLPIRGMQILQDLIGEGQKQPDYPLEKFIERMPKSRLTPHPLISLDPKVRRPRRRPRRSSACGRSPRGAGNFKAGAQFVS